MNGGWLFRKNNKLFLYSLENGSVELLEFEVGIKDFGLFFQNNFLLYFILESEGQFIYSKSGQNWKSVSIPKEFSFEYIQIIPDIGYFLFNSGSSSFLFEISIGQWHVIDLPEGSSCISKSITGNWYAGGYKTNSGAYLKKKSIIWKTKLIENFEWEPIYLKLSFFDAYKTIRNGGYGEVKLIDFSHDIQLAATECSWFTEDPSWFVFYRSNSETFKVLHLKDEILAKVTRDRYGHPSLYSSNGSIWIFKQGKFIKNSYRSEILKHLKSPERGQFISMSKHNNFIFAIVHDLVPKRQSIILSQDNGKTWGVPEFYFDEVLSTF